MNHKIFGVRRKIVEKAIRQFEEIWTSHMETNRDRWIEEQEKGSYQGPKDGGRLMSGLFITNDFRGSYRSKTAIETQTFFKNSYIDLNILY